MWRKRLCQDLNYPEYRELVNATCSTREEIRDLGNIFFPVYNGSISIVAPKMSEVSDTASFCVVYTAYKSPRLLTGFWDFALTEGEIQIKD